jgi:hypothetical protein
VYFRKNALEGRDNTLVGGTAHRTGVSNLTGTNRPSRPAEEPSEAFGFLPEGGVANHPEVDKDQLFEAIADFKFCENRSEMISYGCIALKFRALL